MTLKPGSQAVYIRRGDPWEMTVGPSLKNGVAEVIADVAEILCQVRADGDLASPVIVDLAQNAVLSVGGTVCVLSLTGAETSGLETGEEFFWDFQPSSESETWMAGVAVIDPDYSR